ncbi:hypothetical protein L9F63_009553 [Diploptera punctata]|uniref:Uncharacterized protein n=1 Tax=Diploptera punctata TaxID=6984 RepID=A0AAD8AM09_DIPPU|nr:hypothetical protein L9F63_009553 [Diploptera punctata]
MSNTLRTLLFGGRQSLRNVCQRRHISRTITKNDKPTVSVASESTASSEARSTVGMTHIVKPYHKYALVWTGKYKSLADVPERVSHGVLDSALNKARIKIAIWMMIATAVMAGGAVYSGKKAAARGENLAVIGMEHQKKLREQGIKEQEAAKSN